MKTWYTIPVIILLPVMMVMSNACGRHGSGKPLDTVEAFTSAGTLSEKLSFVDDKSRESLERAVSKGAVTTPQGLALLPPLVRGTTWEVMSNQGSEIKRTVAVRITGHPVLNQVGLVVPLKLIHERDGWKIDVHTYVSRVLNASPPKDVEKYLEQSEVK